MVSPRKMVRDSLGFASAQFLVRAAIIARTVLAARLLGPSVFGIWNALQLLMDYGALAPLGTVQGLDQMVPRRIVDQNPPALARVARAGITSILLLSLLFASGCLAFFLRSTGNLMTYWGAWGLVLAMSVMVLSNWAGYHTTMLRSHGNIGAVSLWFFLQGMIGALLGLAMIPSFGAWGLLYGWLAGTMVAFAWTRWEARRIAPLWPLVSSETAALFRIGFPMFFFAGSALIIRSLDRLIILRYLGTRELGYYSLAVTALTLLLYLPDSATFVTYPRLLQRFRAGGDQPEAIRDMAFSVLKLLTVLTPLLGGFVYFFVYDAIAVVLPSYGIGAPAVQAMCFTAGAVSMTNFGSIVIMTLGRQVWLIPVAIASTAAFAIADVLVLRAGFGIIGVAWATLATYAATGTVILVLVYSALCRSRGEVVRRILANLSGIAVAVVLALVIDRLVPWYRAGGGARRLLHAVLGSATFLVAYGLIVGPQLRGLGIRQIVSELSLPLPAWLRRALNLESRTS